MRKEWCTETTFERTIAKATVEKAPEPVNIYQYSEGEHIPISVLYENRNTIIELLDKFSMKYGEQWKIKHIGLFERIEKEIAKAEAQQDSLEKLNILSYIRRSKLIENISV